MTEDREEKTKVKASRRLKMKIGKRSLALCLLTALLLCMLTGCTGSMRQETSNADDVYSGSGRERLRILSGSENKELGTVLQACAKESGVTIEMTYKGSVDIMQELQNGANDYDAVWPASGTWLSLGDTNHLIKYDESISITPVVFGVRQSLAEQLGYVGKEVSVSDILTDIEAGRLSFCMTSATQSNSGASAYIGFLYALSGKTEGLTTEDLEDPQLQERITKLLSGINRSSGSSDWLKDMFLTGDYDAMVNYECLIIAANEALTEQGKEPLYVVYPYDGLSIADSPLGYVDHGDEKKQEAFQKVQAYLLSEEAQEAIQKTGRRTGLEGVSSENLTVFRADWGIDTDRLLSPITMPSEQVLLEALNLYQTSFRKPSLNVYCLDYSGSMTGEGNQQLLAAMEQLLIQSNAEKNLLQAQDREINIIITFDSDVLNIYRCDGADPGALEQLYETLKTEPIGGGTDMYAAALEALNQIAAVEDLETYSPAIILMTDGESGSYSQDSFLTEYQASGQGIPVFSIMFGDANPEQLNALAELSNARVFDGTKDLVAAFRSVKGYN